MVEYIFNTYIIKIYFIDRGGHEMDIERMIRDMGKLMVYPFTRIKEQGVEMIEFEESGDENLFEIMLMKYYYEKQYNEADNLIFDELEHNHSPETQRISKEFYELLLQKTDEQLNESNFSRDEVYESLEEIKKYIQS